MLLEYLNCIIKFNVSAKIVVRAAPSIPSTGSNRKFSPIYVSAVMLVEIKHSFSLFPITSTQLDTIEAYIAEIIAILKMRNA